jgi:hypothetical protein
MTHLVKTISRKADRLLPFLICQEHYSALSAADQVKYAVCDKDCGCTASDCWVCDRGEGDAEA